MPTGIPAPGVAGSQDAGTQHAKAGWVGPDLAREMGATNRNRNQHDGWNQGDDE